MHELTIHLQGFGRPSGDFARESARHTTTTWRYIAEHLSRVSYQLPDGTVEIVVDWSSALLNRERHERLLAVPLDEVRAVIDAEPAPLNRSLALPARISVSTRAQHDGVTPLALCLHHLANIYLLANLASPGSFYALNVEIDDGEGRSRIDWNMASHLFEDVLIEGMERRWPDTLQTDPAVIWEWLRSTGLAVAQVAGSSVHRSLYALLHAADAPPANPTSILWLAHALESLYQTPPALSRAFLKSRITQLVGVPEHSTRDFWSRFSQFYEARNTLVHSGMKIVHPVYNNGYWDDETGDSHWRVTEVSAFAGLLMIASIQSMAHRKWPELVFKEILTAPVSQPVT